MKPRAVFGFYTKPPSPMHVPGIQKVSQKTEGRETLMIWNEESDLVNCYVMDGIILSDFAETKCISVF